ncbi:MAG: hypothetical protein D6690_03840 [Nitrospirae bacterium]|nr:MAG: hypothetical protein D6690_03840 [Nitrospirota bacterium]
MSTPKLLEEAVERLDIASARIDEVRTKPVTLENIREWLDALTDYAMASTEIHQLTNESVHEKLHELAARMGLRHFPSRSTQE